MSEKDVHEESAGSSEACGEGSSVFVNVYNSTMGNNDRLSRFGLGIHHTGVEVYGTEYAYAGHPFDDTGVYEMTPRNEEEVCSSVKYSLTIFVGKTTLTRLQVGRRIYQISKEFTGNTYHLLNKNCNHFTQAVCKDLVGTENLPGWINRVATVTSYVPFIGYVLPASWLYPWANQEDDQQEITSQPNIVSYKRPEPSAKKNTERSYIV